ncbi:hypothetical protein [Bacillus toyonensis]|uniref:hypothetical protein n=1 Tax=Bacillus toyonensis TaxID=155322 RepID=UPI002E21D830|nr:hypothetical protein [Bacillus toyonensis]
MIKNLMNKFVKEEDGGLVEYLILIAIAAVAAALLFPSLRKNLVAWFNSMVTNVQSGISGSGTAKPGDAGGAGITGSQWN